MCYIINVYYNGKHEIDFFDYSTSMVKHIKLKEFLLIESLDE